MNSLIDNYENGNLKDAKRQAKRYGLEKLKNQLIERGYETTKANIIAYYLKSKIDFQAHCDFLKDN